MALHRPGILLVLDGFERCLRTYGGIDVAYRGNEPLLDKAEADRDCINPVATFLPRTIASLPGLAARVLVTTRKPAFWRPIPPEPRAFPQPVTHRLSS